MLIEELEARPDCDFGVSIDTDAYFRTSERLEGVVDYYGLRDDKLILFSQEYHVEDKPPDTIFCNGGFFIVRNSADGRGLLRKWYDVPEVLCHITIFVRFSC